jgi:hypothetical protein
VTRSPRLKGVRFELHITPSQSRGCRVRHGRTNRPKRRRGSQNVHKAFGESNAEYLAFSFVAKNSVFHAAEDSSG